jgi:integrase/recombinase XerC
VLRGNNVGPASAAAGASGCADAAVTARESDSDTATAIPDWFADFLIDPAPRKPSEHTMKAYRQDFAAVASLLTAGSPGDVTSR